MTIASISTLISSIALVGVAISLLLQNRQLRTSQLEASRAAQSSLIQMGLANPKLAAEALGFPDGDWLAKAAFVNWQVKYWEMSYSIRVVSAKSVRAQAASLFASDFAREWWRSGAREFYRADATTKHERECFVILDTEFERKNQAEASSSS